MQVGFSFRGGKWSELHRPDLRNRHFLFQLRVYWFSVTLSLAVLELAS